MGKEHGGREKMNCEETREHLESCEDCRLHVAVEARLRTLPVLEPPQGLAARVMKALPRAVPVKREFLRLAAAAGILIALIAGAFGAQLDRHRKVDEARAKAGHALRAVTAMATNLGGELWRR
jgi:hypothetical protein